MEIQKVTKEAFTVIGKEGSTEDGEGFVQRLWEDANSRFGEVAPLAKTDENGALTGIWGAMTDFSGRFQPWEDHFSRGKYLAGVECREDAQPPAGWSKWVIPGFEYLCAACDSGTVFEDMITYLSANGLPLVGAVQDFTCPRTGKNYMLFPIRKL